MGDSEYDIRIARAAVLLAVGAGWGTLDRDALLAAGPDHVLEAPGDLLGLL